MSQTTTQQTFKVVVKEVRYYEIDVDETEYLDYLESYYNERNIQKERWYKTAMNVFKQLCKRRQVLVKDWGIFKDYFQNQAEAVDEHVFPLLFKKYKVLKMRPNQEQTIVESDSDEE